MAPIHNTAIALSWLSIALVLVFVLKCFLYVRNWRRMRGASPYSIPAWRVASFLLGMFLVWGALASPLIAYDHDLLTVHMIQHLLLMTFAPALILLGEPLLAFWNRLPRFEKVVLGRLFRRRLTQWFARAVSRPVLCWTVSALTLLGWHVPA